jgi:hypothetical protein
VALSDQRVFKGLLVQRVPPDYVDRQGLLGLMESQKSGQPRHRLVLLVSDGLIPAIRRVPQVGTQGRRDLQGL